MRKQACNGEGTRPGPEHGLKLGCPGPAPELPPAPRALSAVLTPGRPEATAVLTVRLWLLSVAHSQGAGFGLFFVPPDGGVELLVINWTKETRDMSEKCGNPGTSNQRGRGERGCLPEAYIGCAARNSPPCWWAQRMSRCLSSCSAALPADGPWHPPWK